MTIIIMVAMESLQSVLVTSIIIIRMTTISMLVTEGELTPSKQTNNTHKQQIAST